MKTGVSRRAFYLFFIVMRQYHSTTIHETFNAGITNICGKIPVVLLFYTFTVMWITLHLVNLKKSCKS